MADVENVLRLEQCTAQAPHWAQAEYAGIIDRDGVESVISRCFFVAEMEGRLAGFAVGRAVGRGVEGLAELESIAVGDAFRRMGAGRALCEAVIDWCRGLGVRELELEVRAGSDGAIALYQSLNFVATGRRSRYYQNPEEDALLMLLEL